MLSAIFGLNTRESFSNSSKQVSNKLVHFCPKSRHTGGTRTYRTRRKTEPGGAEPGGTRRYHPGETKTRRNQNQEKTENILNRRNGYIITRKQDQEETDHT